MSDAETFYEVLSVPPDASRETIQRAYREMVKEHHPDVSEHPDARERFKRITRAKTVLTDPAERTRYDRLGHEAYLARERSGTTHGDVDDTAPRQSASSASAATTDASGPDAGTAGRGDRAGPRDAARGSGPGTGPPGRFALREAAAALVVGLLAVASVALSLVPRSTTVSLGVLLASWVIVAAVAGRLAAGGVPALPDDVVRAHAFPLLVFVVAWYVATGTEHRLLAGGLATYGLFAALFRTVAMASSGGTSALRPTGLWFLATAPAAVVLYGLLTGSPGVLRVLAADALSVVPGPVESEPVLAAAAAVAVVFGHAVWRFGRVVV